MQGWHRWGRIFWFYVDHLCKHWSLTMLSVRKLAIAVATASFGFVGCAQTPADHGGLSPGSTPAAAMSMPLPMASAAPLARMDEQMKAMQAMHDKMMQAQTPEQRNALMAAHRAVMQDSMAMMGSMGHGGMMAGGAMGAMGGMNDKPDNSGTPGMQAMPGKGAADGDMGMHHQMMEKRMQMMQSMMQLMMDNMPAMSGKP
jgi:hypothetical protein